MPSPGDTAADLLREAEQQLTAAERTGDAAALRRLLAPDFAGHDLRGCPTTRETFIAAFTSPELRFASLTTDAEHFRLIGDVGLVGGNSRWQVHVGGQLVGGMGRFLDVWHWRAGRWQLTAAAVTARAP